MDKKAVSITKIGYPEDRYGNLDKRLQALHIEVLVFFPDWLINSFIMLLS